METLKIDAEDPSTVLVFTDGSCFPNPNGDGGWAFYVTYNGKQAVRYGSRKGDATNNLMELLALLHALLYVPAGPKYDMPLLIYTDSKYCQQAVTSWIQGWIKSGWRTSNGSPVKNREVLEQIHELVEAHRMWRPFEIRWVRGHSGIPENELVDQAANTARKQQHTNWNAERDSKN